MAVNLTVGANITSSTNGWKHLKNAGLILHSMPTEDLTMMRYCRGIIWTILFQRISLSVKTSALMNQRPHRIAESDVQAVE